MIAVTKYKAEDGTEFGDPKKCADYEASCMRIADIMSQLHPKPDTCDFSNGSGFIQHNPEAVRAVTIALCQEAQRFTDHKWLQETIDNPEVHPSWVGRLIGEYDHSAINSAWYRISCIDKQGREWGQPYYREHSKKAEQVCLNN